MFNEHLIKMTNRTEFLRAIPRERARTFLECDCRVCIVECYVESTDIGATVYHREMPQNAKVTKMVGFEVFYGKKLAPNGTYLVFQKPEVCPEGYFVVCTDHWRILDANRLYQLEPQNGGEPTFTRMAKTRFPKLFEATRKVFPNYHFNYGGLIRCDEIWCRGCDSGALIDILSDRLIAAGYKVKPEVLNAHWS